MRKTISLLLMMVLSAPLFAIEPFTITDIRVEGLSRLEEGTVYNYLPLKVGDEANDEEVAFSVNDMVSSSVDVVFRS